MATLCIVRLLLLFSLTTSFLSLGVRGNCDVYKRTMDSLDFWRSYDFSSGVGEALGLWFAEDAQVTLASNSDGTIPASKFYEDYMNVANIAKMDIRLEFIDCATDGEWCHMRVFLTYYTKAGGVRETVSLPQYWTYIFDPVTCNVQHYILLTHTNDWQVLMDTLKSEQQEL